MKRSTKYLFASFLAACCLLTTACQESMEEFDNKVFISNSSKVETLLLKGTDTGQASIQTAIAKQEKEAVKVTYKADPALVAEYNNAFYSSATMLPKECYEIPEPTSTIAAGGVKGTPVSVYFKELSTLDRDLVYVLPVTVANANLGILSSARTRYFVIKAGALINVVANVKNNKLDLKLTNASALNNLKQLTAEALIRVDKFGKLISTIMGIEGSFLIRIGDAGIPDNQIQLATSSGNVTDPAWTLKTNEWTHVAVTFNSSDGSVEVYLNGVKKGTTQKSFYNSEVNWGNRSFWIAYSYEDGRFLDGDICECRIWNRVLKAEEIQAKKHFYSVDPTAEGLVGYWKFDEGSGTSVKDHTANGNDAIAAKSLTWKAVELPAK